MAWCCYTQLQKVSRRLSGGFTSVEQIIHTAGASIFALDAMP